MGGLRSGGPHQRGLAPDVRYRLPPLTSTAALIERGEAALRRLRAGIGHSLVGGAPPPVRGRHCLAPGRRRGCGMPGPGRLLVSCARVPARAENSPQKPIRAGGRAGGQRSGSMPVNARESTGCMRDVGGPPFTLSPRSRWQRTKFAAILFSRALDAAPCTPERATGLERGQFSRWGPPDRHARCPAPRTAGP